MWRWRNEHVLAWAICVAVIACPRGLWDRVRLRFAQPGVEAGAGPAGGADAAEVAALRADNAELRARLMQTEAARAELERTLGQTTALTNAGTGVRAESRLPVRIFGAAAAAAGASAKAGRVRLDAGTRAGVRAQAPLVSGGAIVGRVVSVSEDASEAELVTAMPFRARCRNVRTGAEGMLRGDGAGAIRFRPDPASGPTATAPAPATGRADRAGGPADRVAGPDLREGDAIVTSSFSTFAPGGLAVGDVTGLARDPDTGFPEAVVHPTADLAALERGLVILDEVKVSAGGTPGAGPPGGAR